ncbi:MAG TPA: helix-turn-helix domain-containing protein [Solirubrobacteraceae bacterium]|nr:helix-turn-helix domain-containing protein [Solirubrobacteraceae bacterium]
MPRQAVYLLDADPDLGDALDPEDRRAAHRYAVARLERVPEGAWPADRHWRGDDDSVGLLVLDGLLTRDLYLADRKASELLGTGDLLRPWQDDERRPGVTVQWTVHDPLRLAVIDRRLMLVAARWPAIADALVDRAFRRARALAFNLAMSQLVGIDRRLLMLFWDAASRWGRVTPEGVRVRLPLTHQTLARLVGSRRPSVSLALADLTAQGRVQHEGADWLLCGEPPQSLAQAS